MGTTPAGNLGPLTDVKQGPVLCSVRLPMQEMQVQTLTQEDPLEEGMATCSRVLAWRIPRTEEPRGLQPMGSQSRTRLSDGHTQRGTTRAHRDPGPLTTASQPPSVAKDTVSHPRERWCRHQTTGCPRGGSRATLSAMSPSLQAHAGEVQNHTRAVWTVDTHPLDGRHRGRPEESPWGGSL